MKHLLGKARKTVTVKFLDEDVDVVKLSVADVEAFQAKLAASKDDETKGLSLQRDIIRMGVVGADELSDEELDSFPLDDLSALAADVLKAAGVRNDEGK